MASVRSFADLASLLATPTPVSAIPADSVSDIPAKKVRPAKTTKPAKPRARRQTDLERRMSAAIQLMQQDEARKAKINARVLKKWGSFAPREPKSIHDPVPPARIRREPPRKRNPFRANVDNHADLSVRSREFTFGPNTLIGGRIIARV